MFTRTTSILKLVAAVVLLATFAAPAVAADRFPGERPAPPIDDIDPVKDPVKDPIRDPRELPERIALPERFIRGDADGSGAVEMSDAVTILSNLFLGTKPLKCKSAADANSDGELGISDAVHTLAYLFVGSVRIAAPFPGCGTAAAADGLGCEDGGACQPDAGSEAFQVTRVERGYLIDLPEIMVSAFPEEASLEMDVDGLVRTKPVSGIATKLSATTLFLETSGRESLATRSRSTLNLRVPAKALAFQRLGFTCGTFVCECNGDDDCNDLFSGGNCGGDAVCISDNSGGVWCICWRGGAVLR